MNKEEVFKKILSIINDCLPSIDTSSLVPETEIDSISDLNSLSLMMILFDTEEKFGVSIDEPNKIRTINDICSYVIAKNN